MGLMILRNVQYFWRKSPAEDEACQAIASAFL